MRIILTTFLLALAGCRSVEPAPVPPPTPLAMPTPPVKALLRPTEREGAERRQAQLIEALINQNEALTQRLSAPRPLAPTLPERRTENPALVPASRPFLVANAEGFIDLRPPEGNTNEPVNPFDVPVQGGGKGREVSLTVSGIIAGAETCAVINERMVQPGDAIESLTVETIARDAVFLALGERRLRLNVSETPVRVRLPD